VTKWLRSYTMKVVGKSGEEYTFAPPLTLQFDVCRTVQKSLNTANFRLYNISPAAQRDIYKDDPESPDTQSQTKKMSVTLEASYQSMTTTLGSIVFSGTIQDACTYRSGGTVITEINALDGSDPAMRKIISKVFGDASAGCLTKKVLEDLTGLLGDQGIKSAVVGSFTGGGTRRRSVFGPLWDVICDIAGPAAVPYIDSGRSYVLNYNDAFDVPGNIPAIDGSVGLIGTPRKYFTRVDLQMVFEPRVTPGQLLGVSSKFNELIQNDYLSVQKVRHSGTISGAVDGGAVTDLVCTISPYGAPNVVTPL